MFTIRCADLGVRDCTFEVAGETPAEVINSVRQHLANHDIKLPPTDEILGIEIGFDRLLSGPVDKDAELIIRRLREILNIEQEVRLKPSIGRTVTSQKLLGNA